MRADARYCSGRCRVAHHRGKTPTARPSPPWPQDDYDDDDAIRATVLDVIRESSPRHLLLVEQEAWADALLSGSDEVVETAWAATVWRERLTALVLETMDDDDG